jgi:histidine ammonia-lyase
VSQNKQLCTPASVDSIVSSNGQEDHVSMGANAATKLYKVIQNVQQVLAIEMLLASKAIAYRRPLKSSPEIESYVADYTSVIPTVQGDQYLSPIMRASKIKIFGQ